MSKSPDAFRTIREVADWLGVAAHVLRFWESKFTQIKPVKRAGGRRYYRPADMELVGGIKVLLHDRGMTVRGVQRMLREEGVATVAALSPPLDAIAVPSELLEGIADEAAWHEDAEVGNRRAPCPCTFPDRTGRGGGGGDCARRTHRTRRRLPSRSLNPSRSQMQRARARARNARPETLAMAEEVAEPELALEDRRCRARRSRDPGPRARPACRLRGHRQGDARGQPPPPSPRHRGAPPPEGAHGDAARRDRRLRPSRDRANFPEPALRPPAKSLEEPAVGLWRSLVARPSGGRKVAGSSPASPTNHTAPHSAVHRACPMALPSGRGRGFLCATAQGEPDHDRQRPRGRTGRAARSRDPRADRLGRDRCRCAL
jgi:DNA-binding transcriptional MerR regulator